MYGDGGGGGQCFCVCDDERWSDHNLLGRASCVPEIAHLIFGRVGLAVSAAALCQAAYQLHRQRIFHALEPLAPTLPVEKCRRLLHHLSVAVSVMCICLFSLVLGDELRWSGVLASAIHIPSNVSGILVTRIWIYSTSHGLMNRSPEMLSLSSWLETPVGYYASCIAVAIVPCTAVILSVTDHPEVAAKTTAAGLLLLSTLISGTIWICGKSLLRVIDESLEAKKKAQVDAKFVALADSSETAQEDFVDHGDQTLLSSKKKVKWMLGFVSRQLVVMGAVLVLDIFSEYGTAAPLLLFGLPLVFLCVIKLIVVVQLFSGRSKLSPLQGVRFGYGISGHLQAKHRTSLSLSNLRSSISRKGRVVPIENPPGRDHAPPNEIPPVTGATVRGQPPFSLPRLGHSGEWLCS